MRFADRHDAGRRLASMLEGYKQSNPVVVGVARGGVTVAAEVARALGTPLDVALVCKIGAPKNPEFALGALAEGGVGVISERAVRSLGLSEHDMSGVVSAAERQLAERLRTYRSALAPAKLEGRTAILVDDGLATGRSARAAARSLRARGATHVILAVPVAARQSVHAMHDDVDEIICVQMPSELWAVGHWYEEFAPVSDEEVVGALTDAQAGGAGAGPAGRTRSA
jgi:predicted phosphoribosyltransferase